VYIVDITYIIEEMPMAGVKGKSGRHMSDIKREGYYFRMRPEVIARVERCTPLLEIQEGVRMSKAEALEHLLTMACAALERALDGRETPTQRLISGISEISDRSISKISAISGEDISVPGYGFPGDEDEPPAPQPTTQPAIPLALEPAPKTAQPVPVPHAAEAPVPHGRPGISRETLQAIAEEYTRCKDLSRTAFVLHLFEKDIYRAKAKDGSPVPMDHSRLRRLLERARDEGML
jgi:hypothetical protein